MPDTALSGQPGFLVRYFTAATGRLRHAVATPPRSVDLSNATDTPPRAYRVAAIPCLRSQPRPTACRGVFDTDIAADSPPNRLVCPTRQVRRSVIPSTGAAKIDQPAAGTPPSAASAYGKPRRGEQTTMRTPTQCHWTGWGPSVGGAGWGIWSQSGHRRPPPWYRCTI